MAGTGGRRSNVVTWMERAALGAIMGAAAFVLERRLLKSLRRRGAGSPTPTSRRAELSAAPQQVDQ